jgi:hypothetical protein
MKLGIMQPYFFPYIGYWQLMNIVDTFVIYDDVTFIKQGYINRNNILSKDKVQLITLELNGASSNKLINEIDIGKNSKKILKTISQNYSKAPYFKVVYPMLEEILLQPKVKLSQYIGNSLITVAKYLEMDTKFLYSSDIDKKNSLKAQDKVIEINKQVGATTYINAIGGKELYVKEDFLENNIELQFLKTDDFMYKQFEGEFIPYLSIIDLMMFNSKEEVKTILHKYSLQ